MPTKVFLLEDTPLHPQESSFKVEKPGFWAWLLTILITAISFALSFIIFTYFSGGSTTEIIISVILIIFTIALTPWLYNKVGMQIAYDTIIESYKMWNDENKAQTRGRKLLLWLIGVKYHPKHKFYVQAKSNALDLGKTKDLIKSRILDIVSISIGITFGLLTIIGSYLTMTDELFIFFMIFIFITPILSFLIIPIIWTLKDSNLRAINDDGTVESIGEQASNSIVSKILGIEGIILGFSFLLDYTKEIDTLHNLSTPTILIYIIAALYLGLFVLLASGVCLLIGFIYLLKYHEKNVNKFRSDLISLSIPAGIPMVRKADDIEIKLLKETPDKGKTKNS